MENRKETEMSAEPTLSERTGPYKPLSSIHEAAMKKNRADEIAQILGKPERWHSHGRGIGIKELASDEIKLVVKNYGDDPTQAKVIREYYDLVMDYFGKVQASNGIHGPLGVRRL